MRSDLKRVGLPLSTGGCERGSMSNKALSVGTKTDIHERHWVEMLRVGSQSCGDRSEVDELVAAVG